MTKDELLERGDETVTIKQIVERFEAVEQEYNGVPWTLKQIYTQIDMLVSEKPCGDCVSREETLKALMDEWTEFDSELMDYLIEKVKKLPSITPQPKIGSSSENPNKWIPITSRPMTEEENEHYKTHPEYRDECRIFNCKLPDDGQEVLISICGGVEVDTFVQDANDGCYFEGRDIYDVDAWMPLPLPYKQEVEG